METSWLVRRNSLPPGSNDRLTRHELHQAVEHLPNAPQSDPTYSTLFLHEYHHALQARKERQALESKAAYLRDELGAQINAYQRGPIECKYYGWSIKPWSHVDARAARTLPGMEEKLNLLQSLHAFPLHDPAVSARFFDSLACSLVKRDVEDVVDPMAVEALEEILPGGMRGFYETLGAMASRAELTHEQSRFGGPERSAEARPISRKKPVPKPPACADLTKKKEFISSRRFAEYMKQKDEADLSFHPGAPLNVPASSRLPKYHAIIQGQGTKSLRLRQTFNSQRIQATRSKQGPLSVFYPEVQLPELPNKQQTPKKEAWA